MKTLPQPYFARNELDKADELRPGILEGLALGSGPEDRFLLLSESGVVTRADDSRALFTSRDIADLPRANGLVLFLGRHEGRHYFALPVPADLGPLYAHKGLREFARQDVLPESQMGMFAQARSLLAWHASHGFCPNCGAATAPAHGGWRRDCPECGREHYPRVDPVVIMLVTCGDWCLLGYGRKFKVEGLYSCLAGFIEPGETVEAAARRELMEEAGVEGLEVSYLLSQPWPFPYNLMLGLHVRARDMRTVMDEKELRDLKWVNRDDVAEMLAGRKVPDFRLPTRETIARRLLEIWVAGE